jgi:hypothetical protein
MEKEEKEEMKEKKTTIKPASSSLSSRHSDPTPSVVPAAAPTTPSHPSPVQLATAVYGHPQSQPSLGRAEDRAAQEKAARIAAEETAQSTVVGWYQRAVDTGFKPVVRAHTVAKAIKVNDAKMDFLERLLRSLYPPTLVDEFYAGLKGRRERNIIPLSPNLHVMLNKLLIAIRPIKDPQDEDAIFLPKTTSDPYHHHHHHRNQSRA